MKTKHKKNLNVYSRNLPTSNTTFQAQEREKVEKLVVKEPYRIEENLVNGTLEFLVWKRKEHIGTYNNYFDAKKHVYDDYCLSWYVIWCGYLDIWDWGWMGCGLCLLWNCYC